MADGIDISWEVDGQDALIKSLNDAADASERASQALRKQGAAMKYVDGPAQKLARYDKQFAHASAAGNAAAVSDINRRIEQVSKQLAPKTVSTFSKRLETAIRSTRFNVGGAGGISPLIGQAADLFGVGAGPFGLALTAAQKGLEMFSEAMSSAADAASKFGQLQTASGSSPKTTGALSNLGISAGDADAFNTAITTDNFARSFATQLGVSNAPGPFGSQDHGQLILDALKALHGMKDKTEALRYANAMHLSEPYSRIANLSDASFRQRIGPDAEMQAKTFNSQYTHDSAEFNNAKDRFGEAFSRKWEQFVGPSLATTAKVLNEITNDMGKSHSFSLQNASGRNFFGEKAGAPKEDRYGNPIDPTVKAMDNLQKAIKDNTKIMGVSGRQYGHGERTDAALPRGYGMGNGQNLESNLHALARQLGAFG